MEGKRATASMELSPPGQARLPWWLWWNVLSVDAPTVSVVWAILFAECYGARLSAAQIVALILAIWTIYAGDRVLDSWRATSIRNLQERHLFCSRHVTWMICLIALSGSGSLWVSTDYLNAREEVAGIRLGLIVCVYLLATHAGGRRIRRILPKELLVGALFAAGTTLPVWYGDKADWHVWLIIGLFALLCSLNCVSIESWECEGGAEEKISGLLSWSRPRLDMLALGLGIISLLLLPTEFVKTPGAFLVSAISMGSFLILLLNRCRRRFSRPALRVLVDLALVTAGVLALAVRI